MADKHMGRQIHRFANAIFVREQSLPTFAGFVDCTATGTARSIESFAQKSMYNGHKCNYSMKFQAVFTPTGILLYITDPFVGRLYDWFMRKERGLDAGRIFACFINLDTLSRYI